MPYGKAKITKHKLECGGIATMMQTVAAPSAHAAGYLPRLSEALTWLHMRTRTLERIREIAPDSEVSRLAGQVLTCGPDGKTLCGMANAAMDKADNGR